MEAFSIVISLVALVVSIMAYYRSSKSLKLQDTLNQYEIEKRQKERTPMLKAEILPITGSYRVRVVNVSEAYAFNINADIPAEYDVPIVNDNHILPYESLGPGESFEFWIDPVLTSKIPFEFHMTWYDEDGKEHNKTQHLTLQM